MEKESERDIRNAVIESARRELVDARKHPDEIISRRPEAKSQLSIKPEFMPELEAMAGFASYSGDPYLGNDLTGQPVRTVKVSLERLIRTAVERNIAVEFARLGPAVSEAQVAAAEAAFDWTLFNNFNYINTDSPRTGTSFNSGISFTPGLDVQQVINNSIGVRRTLISGGRLTIQQDLANTNNATPGQTTSPDPANQASFTLQYDQPLLKNAGSEVTQAEIRVARNAERGAVQTLRRDLIRIVTDTEKTYWELVQAYYDLRILNRLLERGEKSRDQLMVRERIDTNQAQIADAVSRVEQRKVDVLRAQQQIRILNDRLKALVNDPSFPVGSEVFLNPADFAPDAPIKFSLLESMQQAIQNRPEVQSAIIAIDDASIRQAVARNQRLPDLSTRLQARFTSLDQSMEDAIGSQFSGQFVDYLVGAAFEMPIGNRRAEAEYRRRRLERMQTVLAYQNAVQTAVVDVKAALYQTLQLYRQITQTEIARLAAAETLRVLEVEKEGNQGVSVERLDLELNRQESLARAEREEVLARVGYASALADLFAAMGTTLERNQINLIVPASTDVPWDAPDR
ncbi:MAG: TolC family protein [Phycisphaerae bacterium]|nr:TolC family protein [Phycisphaerae bacterium]